MKNMIPTNNGVTAGALLSFIKVVSYVLLVLINIQLFCLLNIIDSIHDDTSSTEPTDSKRLAMYRIYPY